MNGLFQTLLRPDQEELENIARGEVTRAANYLEVGEFQLLQLAYREWHQEELSEERANQLFNTYMLQDTVPHWAGHYARQVLRLAEAGRLDEAAARYHRYDHDFGPVAPPHGWHRFAVAAGIVVLVFGMGVLGAVVSTAKAKSATDFPPYISDQELHPAATADEIVQQRPTQ